MPPEPSPTRRVRKSGSSEVLHAGYPLAYVRGGTHLVVVNPRQEQASVGIDRVPGAQLLLGEGAGVDGSRVTIGGFGFGVWELTGGA